MGSLKSLRVLLSSPGDQADACRVAREVLGETNRDWGEYLGIHFDPFDWRVDSHPDVGDEAQEPLTKQIGDVDIYFGFMGTRFGQPTERYGSGTEEEFESAYEKWEADRSSMSIRFYFSHAPVDPLEPSFEPEQLAKVREFRSRIAARGVLYGRFESLSELRASLRFDIARLAQKHAMYAPDASPETLSKAESEALAQKTMEMVSKFNEGLVALRGMNGALDFGSAEAEWASWAFRAVGSLAKHARGRRGQAAVRDVALELRERCMGMPMRMAERFGREGVVLNQRLPSSLAGLIEVSTVLVRVGHPDARQLISDNMYALADMKGPMGTLRIEVADMVSAMTSLETVELLQGSTTEAEQELNEFMRDFEQAERRVGETINSLAALLQEIEKRDAVA